MAAKRTPEMRITDAALKLAADGPWNEISLSRIANKANVKLSELARHFSTRSDIIAAFIAGIDRQVLDSLDETSRDESARDRLFDVLMKRFDALAPHKRALKSIVAGVERDPLGFARLVRPALRAQSWMMAGAGLERHNLSGALRISGLALVYGSVFRTWLRDDDPGLARTMAALDRALRRGESWLSRADLPLSLGHALCDFARGWRRARRARDDGGQETPDTEPSKA